MYQPFKNQLGVINKCPIKTGFKVVIVMLDVNKIQD